jgi:hypothetical protein
VSDVVLLAFDDTPPGVCAGATPRVPVLICRDALVAGGATVEMVTASADSDVDEVLDHCFPAGTVDPPVGAVGGRGTVDGRVGAVATVGAVDGGRGAILVVAAATDSQLRAVVRRMTRRYAPVPSRRPDSVPADRTLPDLPPIGVLPIGEVDLVTPLRLPTEPAAVAAAVLGNRVRRLDLLRNDGGSVTLHGVVLGGTDDHNRTVPFAARVEVDDAVLSDGSEPLIVAAVANADGYARLDGLTLTTRVDPADGVLDVAVALMVGGRSLLRRHRPRIEVRRARGRAVAVHPRAEVAFIDDGVAGTLTHSRTWWMERGAWAVYTNPLP